MKSRVRFSLRAFFVVTTIACAALYHWHISSRLRTAEAELRQLRAETGRLTIDDESKVHAIAVETAEPNTWRWRLFIPKGHRYSWNVGYRDIPMDGAPSTPGVAGFSNEPYWDRANEVIVDARLAQAELGEWTFSVQPRIGDSSNQMTGASIEIPAAEMSAINENSSFQVGILGDDQTEILDPAVPIVLYTKRPMKRSADGSRGFNDDPTLGLSIWLEPY